MTDPYLLRPLTTVQRTRHTLVPNLIATSPPPPPSGSLTDDGTYIYTYEPVFSGTVLADDFSRGWWYRTRDNIAAERGWCGTLFDGGTFGAGSSAGGILATRPGAVVDLGGGNYAATSGYRSVTGGSGLQADHNLKRACTDLWVRFYIKPLPGYLFGAEKRVTFNDGTAGGGGIKWGNWSWNGGGSTQNFGSTTMGFQAPGEDVINTMGYTITQAATTAGTWHCIILRMKLNTLYSGGGSGSSNGEFYCYSDACGAGTLPVNPVGSPTLRYSRTNVNYNRNATSEQIRVLWFESWANPASTGECYLGWIHARDDASPGFNPLLNP